FGSSPPVETFRLDQLLVGLVLTPVALGYFVAALAFTNVIRFIGQSVGLVTYPRVAAAADKRSQIGIIRLDFLLGAIVCTSITVALALAMPWLVPFFFGPESQPAVAAARVLVVAAL